MATEPVEITTMRRALGARLAAFRKVAGLQQGQLADALFCDRTTLVHIERGRRTVDERFWRAADRAVHADGALLTDFRLLIATKAAYERERQEQAMAAAREQIATLAAQPPAHPAHQHTRVGDDDVAQHDLDMAADESTEFLAWAEAENVGELTIEQLHSELRRIAHAYGKAPIAPLFTRTRKLRDRAFTLLGGQQRPDRTRDLYAAAGWSLTILALMSVDLGRTGAAADHTRTAWLCAERADHDGLRGWVRATQQSAAFWDRNYEAAAGHAADGLRYATGSAKLYLASNYANDLALTGDTVRASETLRFALQLAETNDQTADEMLGKFTCGVARAGGLWSEAQLNLGAADTALDHADRAIATFEADPPEQREPGSELAIYLDKARAHLALGQLDGADLALVPVLETPPELRTRRLMIRVQDVHDATNTERYRTDPTTTRIRDAITGFLHETNQREFPS